MNIQLGQSPAAASAVVILLNDAHCHSPRDSGSNRAPANTRTTFLQGPVIPVLLGLAAAAAATLTPICGRADEATGHSVRVSLAHLDLGSVVGARKAYSRLVEAAYEVCGESTMDIEVMVRGPGECVRDSLARAVRDVASAKLSNLYIRRNGIKMAAQYGIAAAIVASGN